ncbi:MAG: APC family permease [Acidobacteria bacterium]|nr:APC family permease [Acidobacteriota bacterium]MBV9474506.1 APC family permease [Acidobacteriota bacterium]
MSDQSAKLIRTVGLPGLVAMCINAVVGSGVFLLPYESYKLLGPFSLWAPLLFAIPVFVLVLCFAEASSHFTEPGGAYLYARSAFGDFVGFETGWMNWLARTTSLASLSNGFVVALALFFPSAKETGPRAAIIISSIVVLALIHLVGVKYGAASIYVFTTGKLVPLVGFIIIALVAWKTNPIPASLHLPPAGTDWNGAALFMLFAYAGFENLGVPAGEFRNPRRDLPLALLAGTVAIAALYVLAQLGAMSALPDLSTSDTPIASAAAAIVGPVGAIVVTLGALLSMAGTNSGTMLEGSRMLFALSLDRNLGPLSYVHPRFRTPTFAILVHSIVAAALALGGSFRQLAMLSAVARLTTYLVTCAAVPRLRKLNEGFRTPGLVLPILGVLISLAFFFNMNRFNFLAATLALVVGALVYLASTRRPRALRT